MDYTETVTITRIPILIQREGRLVRNLTADRFSVRENGVKLEVDGVSEVELPCTVHFLLDLSVSQTEHLRHAGRVVQDLVKSLRQGDRAKLSAFSGRYNELSPYTTAVESILPALGGLEPRGTTALYDGILAALADLSREKGPRVLVILGDEVDLNSRHREDELAAVAKSHGIPLILVQFTRRELKGEQLISQVQQFHQIIEQSGGAIYYADFSVGRKLQRHIREYTSRLQVVYSPPNPDDRQQWRHVSIEVADCGDCTLEYRRAYQIID